MKNNYNGCFGLPGLPKWLPRDPKANPRALLMFFLLLLLLPLLRFLLLLLFIFRFLFLLLLLLLLLLLKCFLGVDAIYC